MSSKAIYVQPGGGYDKVQVGTCEAQAPQAGEITVRLMGVKHVNVESSNGGRWAQTQPNTVNAAGPGCIPSSGAPGFTTSDTRSIYDLSGNLIDQETQTTVYDPEPIVKCG